MKIYLIIFVMACSSERPNRLIFSNSDVGSILISVLADVGHVGDKTNCLTSPPNDSFNVY